MFCPISGKLLEDPALASNGLTYDRLTLLKGKKEGFIELPCGEKVSVELFEDKITKTKVERFLEENPGFTKPVSKEDKEKFLLALKSKNVKELQIAEYTPSLFSEALFGKDNVFQHLAHISSSNNIEKLSFLLKLAKAKLRREQWYGFFEDHIVSKGKASVIVKLIQKNVISVDDNGFSGQNTLLHLAAKHNHKGLIKRLIIKCAADTYLINDESNKAKDMASPSSGVAKLIKESVQKKVFKSLLKPAEEKLNKKIESLQEQNIALKKELNKSEQSVAHLRDELNNVQNYVKSFERRLQDTIKHVETTQKEQASKVGEHFHKIQVAHNNFLKCAQEKKFFKLPQIQSTIITKRIVEACSYDANNFQLKDTYVTLLGEGRYRSAYFIFYETVFTPDLATEKEQEDYRKCYIDI